MRVGLGCNNDLTSLLYIMVHAGAGAVLGLERLIGAAQTRLQILLVYIRARSMVG